MADMDVAVGVGRAVMQHEQLAAGRLLAQALVEVHLLPAGEPISGSLLRQAGAHREFRLRQEKRLGIVELSLRPPGRPGL
jgi:Fe-S oxidoreductase